MENLAVWVNRKIKEAERTATVSKKCTRYSRARVFAIDVEVEQKFLLFCFPNVEPGNKYRTSDDSRAWCFLFN